jgi:cytochrome c556
MRSWYPTLLTAAVMLAWQAPAQAQFARLNDAVKYRQAAFQLMGTHAQRLGAMAKGEVPFDKTSAESNALMVELLSRQVALAFPPGSDMAPSKAKPEVWQDMAPFKSHSDQLQTTSGKLTTAARSGDANAFKTAFNAMAQTCKACHEGYRQR